MNKEQDGKEAWEDILDILDRYHLSADDVISLAEELYDMAQDYLEEISEINKDDPPKKDIKSLARLANIRSPFLDRFPLSKDRWGLDPSLIFEEH